MHSINFKSPEYFYYEKNSRWNRIVVCIFVFFIVLSFFLDNILFSLFLFVSMFLVLHWGKKEPKILDITINDKELVIDDKFYKWNSFDGYYIDNIHLVLRRNNHFSPFVKIIIEEDLEFDIFHIIEKTGIKNFDYNESFFEVLSHLVGF